MRDSDTTQFATVRFGNVLGSNGSVVPRFLDQIKAGGPVTVTHPEIRRYFMLIPEAVQLVLHAAVLCERGAVYVLEMGEQIRLLEMARNIIRLAGFVPDEEIPITFIGLRPGEKLFEELVASDERAEPTSISKIQRILGGERSDRFVLESEVSRLVKLAIAGDATAVRRQLHRLVPSFAPPAHAALAVPTTAKPRRSGPIRASRHEVLSPISVAVSAGK
jgi:FlaA1/EpsC-like NDP-sugar epimerase